MQRGRPVVLEVLFRHLRWYLQGSCQVVVLRGVPVWSTGGDRL